MVVVPDTDIILVKSPLKLDNNNQITFANATAQFNYFASLPKLSYQNCTYQRKDGVIRYDTNNNLTYEDLLQYNYCMYKNKSYKNKWFYAFITDITYINDGMSEVKIETDVFQTWQFDIVYMNSFIEREHVSDDTIGLHTIPEGLEHGEYIINVAGECETALDACYIIIGSTYLPDGIPGSPSGSMRGGVYSALKYCAFKGSTDANKFIRGMDHASKADAITEVFMAPKKFCVPITWSTGNWEGETNIEIGVIGSTLSANIIRNDISLNNVSNLNHYHPRNNKLFTYPYTLLTITNNAGTQAEFHYEDFTGNSPVFSIAGVLCPGISMKLYPNNYKKFTNTASIKAGYDFGIIGGKYPQCSWQSDPYTNWLTQQAVNHQMAPLTLGLDVLGSAKSGDVLGGVTSFTNKVGGMMNEYYQHAIMPPQSRGTNGSDLSIGMSQCGYTYYKMSIKYEYAKKIDDYFTMFGYKVNELKQINIFTRSNWNFIKCVNVNLEGNIPEADLEVIRELFNNGCTFWHNPATFLDYSQANSII